VIPDLDIDVLDANYLEDQRREMRQLRLHMLGWTDNARGSDAFAVLSDSRQWFADDAMERVQTSMEQIINGAIENSNTEFADSDDGRSSDEHGEEYENINEANADIDDQLLEAASCRQVKHHSKVTHVKRWKEERRKETKKEDAMLQKRRRQRSDRMRTLAKKECMRRDTLWLAI